MSTISTTDGRFIRPDYVTGDSGIVGQLVIGRDPFIWVFDGSHIHDGKGNYWDTYDKPNAGKPIYLWPRKTRSKNQIFDELNLSIKQNMFVVQAPLGRGRTWHIRTENEDAGGPDDQFHVYAPPASVEHGVGLISKVDGQLYHFKINSDKGGRFNYPVYLSENALVHRRQGRSGPAMLVHESDWRWLSLPETTHEGAFGLDSGSSPCRSSSWSSALRQMGCRLEVSSRHKLHTRVSSTFHSCARRRVPSDSRSMVD